MPQDLLHTHDKFVGPLPEEQEEGARALHALFPRIFDSKVALACAARSGLDLPSTSLGEAFRWLRDTFGNDGWQSLYADVSEEPALPPNPEALKSHVSAEEAGLPLPKDFGEADIKRMEPSKTGVRAWHATFAEGFDRYHNNGQEHEAAYDAYLTGCCFVAAAIHGLGAGVGDLRRLGAEDEVPAPLRHVLNLIPLYKVVSHQRASR